MADSNKIQIWAELTLDNKQIKTEFTKAWEEAWKSVAEWFEKQKGDIIWRINDIADEIRTKMEALQEMDFSLIDPDKVEEDMTFLQNEMTSLDNQLQNIQRWSGWQEFWEEWQEAFENVKEVSEEYKDTLYAAMDVVQTLWMTGWEAMDEVEKETKETTEAIKEMNNVASQWISESGWLWKMLKFLSSKEIINFFYNNLKKIWEKLIELSGDSEMLAEKWQPVQDKLEQVWWYIGKWLTPAVSTAIDEISWMADELIKTGEDWSSALWMIQQWVFWIWQAFVAVMKLIKQFWQFLGDILSSGVVMIRSFADDLTETASGFIENIWSAEMWSAIWNNIKYGIVSWVNDAIGSLNKLLSWINTNLWIDLWQIGTFDAGTKMDLWFWWFNKTKQARADTKKYMSDSLSDMGQEWADMWNSAMQGSKDLKNTSINDIKKIQNETNKRVWWWSKGSVKSEYEELEDTAVEVWQDIDKMVEEHQKEYDRLVQEIQKVEKEYQNLRDEARDTWREAERSLKDYNDELAKNQWEAVKDLWQRYVELKEERAKEENEYLKRIVGDISDKEWQLIRDEWRTFRGYNFKELEKIKEMYDEMKLIEENTTEEQRNSEEFTKKTSKAQEILNDLKEKELELEEKKAVQLEKQAIATAMQYNFDWQNNFRIWEDEATKELKARYLDREWVWQEIHDQDNIEYARQLENQITGLNDQLDQFTDEKNKEVEILIDTTAAKINLENEYQKVFEENVKKQQKELDWLIQREQELINKMKERISLWWWGSSKRAYWWSILSWWVSVVWENGPETIIARQSSYVQPRNASNNYSTINNDNSFSINGISVNVSNMDEFLNELKEKLTYRS